VTPSPFVMGNLAAAPPGPALDVASGGGRHALAIARTGRVVHAIDRDRMRCLELARRARSEGAPVRVVCADLERQPIPRRRYALVVNTCYLQRSLVPALVQALLPGGLLLFETFLEEQLATGHPRNPAFVLAHGELPQLVAPLEVLVHHEGAVERDGRLVYLAAVAARAPAT
jgi:SAM-dependent methyltransferase